MKTNFEIEDNNSVNWNGQHIDLHNNFDYAGLVETEKDISIVFGRTNGNWIKKNEFRTVNFEFKNVSYKSIEDGDPLASDEDKIQLAEISFFPNNAREINNSIIPQKKPNPNDDLILFFEDGKVIRIGSEEIKLIAE
ncbi:hypothetical protein [Roseivirga echinicomitans]|uniref:Uncharacterized protein n=1 Tax=Roseivirga echinicomitans TaxID=296218 RepID=A0A150X2B0_9BACT|nr:hypothetical protein [Roseivirga echinicomitans]KYG72859.1 hypothetical protein AWN68_09160 [Roseivirga echinicomitans]